MKKLITKLSVKGTIWEALGATALYFWFDDPWFIGGWAIFRTLTFFAFDRAFEFVNQWLDRNKPADIERDITT